MKFKELVDNCLITALGFYFCVMYLVNDWSLLHRIITSVVLIPTLLVVAVCIANLLSPIYCPNDKETREQQADAEFEALFSDHDFDDIDDFDEDDSRY